MGLKVLRYFSFTATLYFKYKVLKRLIINYQLLTHHTRASYCFGFQIVVSASHNISINSVSLFRAFFFYILLL